MQSEEEISTQLPPPIEELDQAMGATQLSDDDKDKDKDKTAPPSPSLVPKKMHLPPLQQVPYPVDFGSLEDLENAPVPDWKSFLPKQAVRYEMFYPQLKPGMADNLEPNTYWAIGQDWDDCEYKINKDFIEPQAITEYCRVKGKRGYLVLRLNVSYLVPRVVMVIIFDVDKLAPHEALVQASQQYDDVAMAKDDWPYAISHDILECVLFADVNYFPEWDIHTTEVAFNPVGLDRELEEHKFIWCNRIKNTLWEFVFLHVWSFFFLNIQQPNPEAELHYSELMAMKFLFLDKMERVSFVAGTKMEVEHLEPFEYWFPVNGMIRFTYLNHMGLTWLGAYEYLNTNIGDRAALEAAGVKGKVKWQLTGDKGWQKEAKKYIAETCGEPKHKKQRKENEKEEEEEKDKELPEPDEPFVTYEKVGRKWKKFTV